MFHMNPSNIRNFCIIAHVDHGKSTLADRMMEISGIVSTHRHEAQLLDDMELEKERGITIKLKAIRLPYTYNEVEYELNLIDTPGHVDFGYEVSRSLAACEIAVLLVDATQGVQAQTIANFEKAKQENLRVLPVVNKIDLPSAQLEATALQLIDLGFKEDEISYTSGKTGNGVKDLIEKIITLGVAPTPNVLEGKGIVYEGSVSKAMVFDSFFDDYRGIVAFIRVYEGTFSEGDTIRLSATGSESRIVQIGCLSPEEKTVKQLTEGEVGFIATGLKNISEVRVGDTMTLSGQSPLPIPGYREPMPVVFLSFYPIDSSDYLELREAMERLSLNDAAFSFEPESIGSIGKGFRCGFLGLLHADIVKERVEREFDVGIITTSPSVRYELLTTSDVLIDIKSPSEYPDPTSIKEVREPWTSLDIYTRSEHMSTIMDLCKARRAIYIRTDILEAGSIRISYEIPLIELIIDFFDKLKSISSGYASIDYSLIGYRTTDVAKMDILVAGELVSPLAQLVQRDDAHDEGLRIVGKLKELIPQQQFKVSLQAAINGKVVAREDISATRKDMIGHLYGGDVTRKKKLLEKQKKGKARMKRFGKVEIPQDVFWKVMER